MANSDFLLTGELRLRAGNLPEIAKEIRQTVGKVKVPFSLDVRNVQEIKDDIVKRVGIIAIRTILLPPTQRNIDNVRSRVQNSIQRGGGANVRVNLRANSANNVTSQLNTVRRSANDARNAVEELGVQTGLSLKRFAGFVFATAGIFAVSNALRESVKEAIDFQNTMVKIGQVTGNSLKQLSPLADEITRLSTQFGVSSKEFADVSLTLAQAGLSALDTRKALDILAKTDLAPTFENLNNTTEAMIAIMGQFGFTVDDMKSKFGSINRLAADFAVEAGDITTAVQRAGSTFQAAGGSLEEFGALFTSVRANTRQSAETIATGFNTIFARIQRLRTVDFLEKFNIKALNDQGNFKGPLQIIEALSQALQDIPTNDPRFAEIVEELGGFRQLSRVVPLLKQFQTTRLALTSAQKGANSLDKDAERANESLARQLIRVREEFNALIRKFGESAAVKSMINFTLQLTKSLVQLSDVLVGIVPLFSALATKSALQFGGDFIGGIGKGLNRGIIPGVAAGAAAGSRGFSRRGGIGGLGGRGSILESPAGLIGAGGLGLLGLEVIAQKAGPLGDGLGKITDVITRLGTTFLLYNFIARKGIGQERMLGEARERFIHDRRNSRATRDETIRGIRSRVDQTDPLSRILGSAYEQGVRANHRQSARDRRDQFRRQQDDIGRSSNVSLGIAGGGAIASVVGDLLQQIKVEKDSGFFTGAGIGAGGLLSGASTGATALGLGAQFLGGVGGNAARGAQFGIYGAVIGGLIGGITGITQALLGFKESIERMKLEELSDKFTKLLDKVAKGEVSGGIAAPSVNLMVRDFNSNLANQTGESRRGTLNEINRAVGNVGTFLDKLAASSNSLEDFQVAAGDSFAFFARFSETPFDDLKRKYEEQIDTIKKNKETQAVVNAELDRYNQRLIDTNNIVSAFSDAAAASEDFGGALTDLSDVVSGNIGSFRQFDLKDIFERALSGRSINTGLLNRTVDNVTSNFTGAIGNDRSQFLSDSAKEAGSILQKLPDILLKTRNEDPLGIEGRFEERFTKKIKGLTDNKEIQGALIGEISGLVGEAQKEPELIQKLRQDPAGVVGKFSAVLEPFLNVFRESIGQIQGHLADFDNQLAQRRKLEQDYINLVNRSVDLQASANNALDSILDRDPILGNQQAFEDRKLGNILNGTGVAGNPAAISAALNQSRGQLSDVDNRLRAGEGNLRQGTELRKERDRIASTISSLTKALEFLASESKRAANIQSEIARKQETRRAKFDFASGFVFNDRAGQADIAKTALFGGIAAATNTTAFVPSSRRAAVGGFLDQFANSRLSIFGVDREETARVGTTTYRRGKDVKRDIIGNDLGLSAADRKGITLPGDSEEALINELKEVFGQMEDANNVLATATKDSITKLGETLEKLNEKFLKDLQEHLIDADIRRLTTNQLNATGDLNLAAKQKIGLAQLAQVTGKPVNSDLLSSIRGNQTALSELGKSRSRLQVFDNIVNKVNTDLTWGSYDFDTPFAGSDKTYSREDAINKVKAFFGRSQFANAGLSQNDLASTFETDFKPNETSTGYALNYLIKRSILSVANSKKRDELVNTISNQSNPLLTIFGDSTNTLADNAEAISKALEKIGELKNVEGLDESIARTKVKFNQLGTQIDELNKKLGRQTLPAGAPPNFPAAFASGGRVPGNGNSDNVPALLTPGEFVLNKQAVKRLGLDTLMAANAQRFAGGGLVGETNIKRARNDEEGLSVYRKLAYLEGTNGTFIDPGSTMDIRRKISNLKKKVQDPGVKALIESLEEEEKEKYRQAGAQFDKRGNLIGNKRTHQAIIDVKAKEGDDLEKRITKVAQTEDGILRARYELGIGPEAPIHINRKGPSAVKIAQGIGNAQRGEAAAATKRIKDGTQERFEKNFFVGPNIPALERLDRTPVKTFDLGERVRHNIQRDQLMGTQLPEPDPKITLGKPVSLGKVGFIPPPRPFGPQLPDLSGFAKPEPPPGESLREMKERMKVNAAASNFLRQRRLNRGNNPEDQVDTSGFNKGLSDKDRESNEKRARRLFRQGVISQDELDRRLGNTPALPAGNAAAPVNRPPIKPAQPGGGLQRNPPPLANQQTGARNVNTTNNHQIPVVDLDRYEKLVNQFTNSSNDLIKQLSTLTLKFDHQVHHTGQLNVVGAMEASKAISDAIIKQTGKLIEDTVKKIKHDQNGNHIIKP